jgi:hypothetical protein
MNPLGSDNEKPDSIWFCGRDSRRHRLRDASLARGTYVTHQGSSWATIRSSDRIKIHDNQRPNIFGDGSIDAYLARNSTDDLQGCVVRWKRGLPHPGSGYVVDGDRLALFVRRSLRWQTDRSRQRTGQSGARSFGARSLGYRGSISPFSAVVCGFGRDARHWRLATFESIAPCLISPDRRYSEGRRTSAWRVTVPEPSVRFSPLGGRHV